MQLELIKQKEPEPCWHCGGEAFERWTLQESFNGAEYVAFSFECKRCTFETAPDPMHRQYAVEYWNSGAVSPIAGLSTEENWQFICEYMGAKLPELRRVCA